MFRLLLVSRHRFLLLPCSHAIRVFLDVLAIVLAHPRSPRSPDLYRRDLCLYVLAIFTSDPEARAEQIC